MAPAIMAVRGARNVNKLEGRANVFADATQRNGSGHEPVIDGLANGSVVGSWRLAGAAVRSQRAAPPQHRAPSVAAIAARAAAEP
jgi:hypothetical protein